MIAVDASALIAILDNERDAACYAEAIAEADPPLVSAATLVEAGIVMFNRHGAAGSRLAVLCFVRHGAEECASLNYGDCFSYALAKASGLPLRFKGQDFKETDIRSAL
jgi:ribonuclease VapC